MQSPHAISYLSSPIVTITVGDTVLTAHLALLQRSPFFNFSNSPAGYPLTVDGLIDESLDAVGCFLQYLYTNEYTPRLIPSTLHAGEMVLDSVSYDEIDEDGSHLLKHARVYTLAEKLGMEELKTLAHSKIHRINSTAKGELAYAKFVYANTSKDDKTIRSPIASFWAHRSKSCSRAVAIWWVQGLTTCKGHILRHEAESEFKGMILEFPQFAYDILSMVLDQKEKGKERGYRGDREEREGTQLTDMAPPGTAEKRPGSTRKRPRTSTLM